MALSFMWERCFLVFLTISMIFVKYQKIMLLLAVLTFFAIYSLYLYKFLRHFLETDCEELEASTDGVETIYLSSNGQKIAFISHLYKRLWNEQSKRKEIEYAFEWNLKLEKEIMKDEKRKLMEKFKDETLALVERLRLLEEEKEMTHRLEQKKILDLEEKCATLEEEKRCRVHELEERQENVMKLENHCVKLAEKNRDLADEIEDLANELNWEKQKVSGLEMNYATLEEEKEKLGKELEEERDAKQFFGVTSEHVSELVELLKGKSLEITDMNVSVKKVEEENKKLGKKKRKLEKKLNKLKSEKKDWVAERENLLVVVDSQASLVQTYKDVLDKEE